MTHTFKYIVSLGKKKSTESTKLCYSQNLGKRTWNFLHLFESKTVGIKTRETFITTIFFNVFSMKNNPQVQDSVSLQNSGVNI